MRSIGFRILAMAATSCALLLCLSARAQHTSAAEQAAYASGLRIDRSMLAGPLAFSPRSTMPAEGEEASPSTIPQEISLIGKGVMLEMARSGPNGQFVRPRLLIGIQSAGLRSWMSSIGIAAERCMLPQFRGRVRRDPESGDIGIAVLASARCTFF